MKMLKYSLTMISVLAVPFATGQARYAHDLGIEKLAAILENPDILKDKPITKSVEVKIINLTNEKIVIAFASETLTTVSSSITSLSPDQDTIVIASSGINTRNRLSFIRTKVENSYTIGLFDEKFTKLDDPEVGFYIFADTDFDQPLTLLLLKAGQIVYTVKTQGVASTIIGLD